VTPADLQAWVLLLPLAAAALLALLPWSRAMLAHRVGALAMALATVLAAQLAFAAVQAGRGAVLPGHHLTWVDAGNLAFGIGTMADPMGAVMSLVVCLLGTLVLVFNGWYMHDDPRAARFPWQFCFFLFAMLGVVLSDNLLQTFVFWELVGLGSYLLIGFWNDKPAAAEDPGYQSLKNPRARGVWEQWLSPSHAQLKAFVVNRFGDAGFLVGIGALLAAAAASGATGEVLAWDSLRTMSREDTLPGTLFGLSGTDLLTLAALGIFCGAVGKSAQFPLHTWLPDAMQGPTTASSIIHAATMVAAGVFLVARVDFLFTPSALEVVGWTGAFTCLLAASIACVQWDLKAVLAYSTVSQLGLMFAALGAGEAHNGTPAAVAHLFTHAVFKCLLFLCAGAVIHACHGCQDLDRLGGLRKKMPLTAWTSLAAVLAILGTPFFSGFWSKDAVLAAQLSRALAQGGWSWGPLVLSSLGSLLTGAYMLRWWFRIFAGTSRDAHVVDHAHDPEGGAKVVLIALAPLTLVWGFSAGDWLDHALGAVHLEAHGAAMALALTLLAVGATFALVVFVVMPARGKDAAGALANRLGGLHRGAADLWGIDGAWNRLFARGLGDSAGRLLARLDLGMLRRLTRLEEPGSQRTDDLRSIDGFVDGIGRLLATVGRSGARLHAGRLTTYVLVALLCGAAVLLEVLR